MTPSGYSETKSRTFKYGSFPPESGHEFSTQSCPVRVQCFDWNAVNAAPLGVYWNDC